MRSKPRVIIMGADGATFDLIGPWVNQGRLPNFARVMREGVHGPLAPAPNMRSAACWTTFYTGKNPGKHGIYEFFETERSDYSIKFLNGSNCAEPSVWHLLDQQGRTSIAVNVPMSYPAEAVKGIVMGGLCSPGRDSNGFCEPPTILAELEERFGTYVIEPGITGCLIGGKLNEAVRRLEHELEQKRQVLHYLIDNKEWDFCAFVFRSLDSAQHCFWKYMDKTHPDHDPALKEHYGEVIFNVYAKLDQALGELLDKLGPDDQLMVMSDHGFGKKHAANQQINEWLASRGYLTYLPPGPIHKRAFRWLFGKTYVLLYGMLTRRQKEWIAKVLPQAREQAKKHLVFGGIDWSRTQAYSEDLFACVHINQAGREGQGIVPPEETPALMAQIRRDLLECVDSQSGEKLVDKVMFADEIYSGPHTDKAPDITIRWREDIDIHGIRIEAREGVGTRPPPRTLIPIEDPKFISGDHHFYGVFLAYGSAFAKGKRIEDARLMDLIPTALYLLGATIPQDMDGKVLASALRDGLLAEQPPGYGIGEGTTARTSTADYSDEDEEAVAERLRGLGYLN